MSKENQNKKYDGQNRCRRCDRPLSDPNANYGWWCAKLVGLDFYVEEDKNLDDDDLNMYNKNIDVAYLFNRSAYSSDKERYGENSKVFIALDNLKQAYKVFPQYEEAIDIVDNEIRWIGDEWGSANIDERVTKFYNTLGKVNKILPGITAPLSTVEQVLAVAYPKEAAYFNNGRNKADKLTYELYKQEGNGTDAANAFKHIYWSAYATNKVGEDYARLFTHAHEFGWWSENANNPEAMKMDLHNNQLGREIGKNTPTRDLEEAVLLSIIEGKAAVLIDGKSVLYNP